MSVFVDDALQWPRSQRWPYAWGAHLIADTLAELHEFAQAIGLRPSWFQDHEFLPHYDVTKTKRQQAIRAGAIPLGRKELVARFRAARTAVMAARQATGEKT